MSLIAFGINHKTAPVEIRERVAFTPEQLEGAFAQLKQHPLITEATVVSTCNRTELYCVLDDQAQSATSPVLDWIGQFHQLDLQDLARYSYQYADADAARHLMRVSCGLDSMVLGEPQILGQIKDAYVNARDNGLVGRELNQLFQQSFSVAKQVRTQTSIGENPVSVAYAAVNLAQRIFSDLAKSRALLIGAGETIELVARHLRNAGVSNMVVANRTLARAQALAEEFNGEAVLLGDIPRQLERADIVIASTASQLPILGKGAVERALKVRKHRPIFMVDIAVPRDIEPQVGDLDDVYLYSVDDLREVIEENMRSRQEAAAQAEELILTGVESFLESQRARGAGQLIGDLRQQTEHLRQQELEKALQQLKNGQDPEQVLTRFAQGLTNKFLHEPMVQLRQASADNRHDLLNAARTLFALD
ncbi:glutamyl-tRNA reductase [Oceanospirillum multiglobuliferum]|uniref:Glutamyl-tRNA reductase n=1 Tax=Oceanospirillum multiglobuliferum TaxID=64969 RepID=A0A1T4LCL3_9GAMM|nr:glutamyl-tRNA reductase [Oceanospirillum multiglobuliferum]OPX56708.1 glutamyl-tRNA reductase [Oceanospirillum multiglobuliferum]SJZ52435.1 glutamyl-tRNA reductase [Oceanospirillum multiglobuliferum]